MPLADVYKLPAASLHIFYDTSGSRIAFNRNGSIFLNLRYYEAWRAFLSPLIFSRYNLIDDSDDVDVHKGSLEMAYTSWYVAVWKVDVL